MKYKGNPFTMMFGKEPNECIARYGDIDEIAGAFSSDAPSTQIFLIEGVRGSGKTVLMTLVAKRLLSDGGWELADLNATEDLLYDLAQNLSKPGNPFSQAVKNGFNVTIGGYGAGVNGGAEQASSAAVARERLEALKKKGGRLLVTIDEVKNGENMRKFASQFQIFVRGDLPVFLLMTGLHKNIRAIQNDPDLTFLLRAPKIHVGPLGLPQIARHYGRIFGLGAGEANEMAEATKGYAFAFQALGSLYYSKEDGEALEDVMPKLDEILGEYVYEKLWSELSETQRRIMEQVFRGNVTTKGIQDALSMDNRNFSMHRSRLIKSGVAVAQRRGFLEAALPRFKEATAHLRGEDVE